MNYSIGSFDSRFSHLMKITKNYKITDTFLIIKDCEGWSDGMVADITNYNLDVVKSMAILRGDKCKRFSLEKETGPAIAKLFHDIKDQEEVTEVDFDLSYNTAILKSKSFKSAVNPIFLKYWVTFYKTKQFTNTRLQKYFISRDLKFMIGPNSITPITVMVDGTVSGIIMPVRLQEDEK